MGWYTGLQRNVWNIYICIKWKEMNCFENCIGTKKWRNWGTNTKTINSTKTTNSTNTTNNLQGVKYYHYTAKLHMWVY